MGIRIAKIEHLDLIIATAALNTVIKQTEFLQKQGVMDAKRALRETKATYKKLKSILDEMENMGGRKRRRGITKWHLNMDQIKN